MPGSAVDTNVFVYAAGMGENLADRPKVALAEMLLSDLVTAQSLVIPIQVCLELHHVLVRKLRLPPQVAAAAVREYADGALVVPTDLAVLEAALDLASRHQMQTYDAVILASAARAGCDILYSEDMQDGFEWQDVRVVNPFA